jgi:hypothetical protein
MMIKLKYKKESWVWKDPKTSDLSPLKFKWCGKAIKIGNSYFGEEQRENTADWHI